MNASDFPNPGLMPSTLKWCGKKCIHHFKCFIGRNKAGGNANDVGVVVRSCEDGNFLLPTNGGTDACMLVGGNGYAAEPQTNTPVSALPCSTASATAWA